MDCRVHGVAKSWTQLSDFHSLTHGKIVYVLIAQSCLILATPSTVACQAPLFMEFSKQEYWSGLPFPLPGHIPHPGVQPKSPALEADSLLLSYLGRAMGFGYIQ